MRRTLLVTDCEDLDGVKLLWNFSGVTGRLGGKFIGT